MINYLLVLSQRGTLSSGRVLGGSGSINYMHHIRGSRHDFDAWEKEGATGWSYKDVLPYFIKSEDVQIPELKDSRKKYFFFMKPKTCFPALINNAIYIISFYESIGAVVLLDLF